MAELGEIESQMKTAFDAGDFAGVATLMVKHYGVEIQAFLGARLRSPVAVDDAFSMFIEDLWTGLPSFAWRCSPRGWAYVLARNAATRLAISPGQRKQRNFTDAERANLSALIVQVRNETQAHQRTEAKERIRAIRAQLDPDDQMLLVLRVDKAMPFRELAVVMNGGELAQDRITEEAARLRKRFERIKAQIRDIARAEGLLEAEPDQKPVRR